MPRTSGRPPTERRNRDSAVMEASIAVMSERGYAGTSMQEIADRVGVLKGSLYHYFSSKEELLYRIVEGSHEESEAIALEIEESDLAALDRLMAWLHAQAIWYLNNRERANIFFTERRFLTGERLAASNEWGRAFESRMDRLVKAAHAEGAIREDLDLRLVTRFIIGAVNDVRFWPSRSGKKFDTGEMADALVAMVRSAVAA